MLSTFAGYLAYIMLCRSAHLRGLRVHMQAQRCISSRLELLPQRSDRAACRCKQWRALLPGECQHKRSNDACQYECVLAEAIKMSMNSPFDGTSSF